MKNSILIVLLIALCACALDNRQVDDVYEHGTWSSILDSARYAQNAHNMQSWAFEIIGEYELLGGLSDRRMLPETDPYSRQLILSLGALSEAARIAAAAQGYALEAEWIGPETIMTDNRWPPHLFRWKLQPLSDLVVDDRLDALTSATTKYATDAVAQVPPQWEQYAQQYSHASVQFKIHSEETQVEQLKQWAQSAFTTEMTHPATRDESEINTHYGKKQRLASPYGITLLPNFTGWRLAMIEWVSATFPQQGQAYGDLAINAFEPALTRAEQLISMSTDGNTPRVWFESGQVMQAFWLQMIADGYSLLPLSQGLQEYAEVATHLEQLQSIIAEDGQRVQMLWAVSQPKDLPFQQSPRIAVKDLIKQY